MVYEEYGRVLQVWEERVQEITREIQKSKKKKKKE